MIRVLRTFGNVVLWLLAVVGVLSVLVWGASRAGWIKPLVVISGSMEPKIMTGDLLVDVPTPTGELEVGDVASIYNPITRNLVSHRIVAIEQTGDATWEIHMKGDANDAQDGGAYEVGDTVWTPRYQLSGAGFLIADVSRPSVVIPLGITLLALVGLTMLPSSRDEDDEQDDEPHDDAGSAPAGPPLKEHVPV
ncbi:signal peptidase I [Cellulomonas sp. HZM]|uniref:signal peptidase I n=1 Tax=Cellulomonas sp. HZM TaxID=1454010 RepID=UPI000493608F|nr:signal peptidase I [Cellulomonas sp. HZM]